MKKQLIFLLQFFVITQCFSQGYTDSCNTFPNGTIIRYAQPAVDLNNNIWFSSNNGISKYDGSTFLTYDTIKQPDEIVVDNNGNIWCARFPSSGLFQFDGTNWNRYSVLNAPFSSNQVKNINALGNEIWFQNNFNTMMFDGVTWTNMNTPGSLFYQNVLNDALIDNNGIKYFATDNGLVINNGSNWAILNTSNFAMASNKVLKVYLQPDNGLWLISGNNLYRYENGSLTSYEDGDLAYNSYFFSSKKSEALVDNDGNFYVTIENSSILGKIIKHTEDGFTSYYGEPFTYLIKDKFNKTLLSSPSQLCLLDFSSYTEQPTTLTEFSDRNTKELNINNVAATILNRGDMHWNPNDNSTGRYFIPKGTFKSPVFASALWIGGLDDQNQLHIAAQTYRQSGANDFWPGPINSSTGQSDSISGSYYNRIWKINKFTIEEFKYRYAIGDVSSGAYAIPLEILSWPAFNAFNPGQAIAPFFDVNGDNIYNPYDGDYPQIKGDQQLTWIFNDTLGMHTETNGAAIGVEVLGTAYAYYCDKLADSNIALNNTTFYHYEIINRSNHNYHDMFIGLWSDFTLGNFSDNFYGCDSTLISAFAYNGDNMDDGMDGYGLNPPMLNIQILNGPIATSGDNLDNDNDGIVDEPQEKHLMNRYREYHGDNSFQSGNPEQSSDYYNYLQAKMKNGVQIMYGGYGSGSGPGATNIPTHFMYSGTPYDSIEWSQMSAGNLPGGALFIMSSGAFTLQSGQQTEIDFAYVFTRDTTGPNGLYTSIARNKADLKRIEHWFQTDSFPSCIKYDFPYPPTLPDDPGFIFPNPAINLIYIGLNNDRVAMEYEIYTIAGHVVKNGKTNDGYLSVGEISAGIYILTIIRNEERTNYKFVRMSQ